MQKNKVFVRIVAVVLAILMVATILISVLSSVSAAATSQSEIDDLKDKKEELEAQSSEIASTINSLTFQQSSALAQKQVLDEQVTLTQEKITNLKEQIATYDKLVQDKQGEVAQLKDQEAAQMEVFKTRVRAMEENGKFSYVAILFGATSFSDFLARMDFISEVMAYDDNVYTQLTDAQKATEAAISDLQTTVEQQKEAQTQREQEMVTLLQQQDQASALIVQIDNSLQGYTDQKAQIDAQTASVASDIDAKVAEKAAQDAAAAAAAAAANSGGSSGSGSGSGSSVVSAGDFLWPSYCNEITCEFGMRVHPITGVYKLHTGVDIGADSGTDIMAATGGSVITSEYDSAYGNYVVIYYKNGVSTLYAHMSQRLVSEGDTVTQGEVIGLVGSTGYSTGAHLHFEIRINGNYQNPLDYFSNYVID